MNSRIEEIFRSSLQKNQDTPDDIVTDGDEHQQHDNSVDSGAPHSTLAD